MYLTSTSAHTTKIEHATEHKPNSRGATRLTARERPWSTNRCRGRSHKVLKVRLPEELEEARVLEEGDVRGAACGTESEPLGRRRLACGEGGAARAAGLRAQVCGGLGRGCGRRLVTGDPAGRARAACGARPEAAAHEYVCKPCDVWACVPTRVHRRRGRWRRRAAPLTGARAACRSRRRRAARCSTPVVRVGCAPGQGRGQGQGLGSGLGSVGG